MSGKKREGGKTNTGRHNRLVPPCGKPDVLSYRTYCEGLWNTSQNCPPEGRKREAFIHQSLFPVSQGLPHWALIGPCTSRLPMHECLEVFTEKIRVRKQEGWGSPRVFLYEVGLSPWGTASMVIRNNRRGQESFFLELKRGLILLQIWIKANVI